MQQMGIVEVCVLCHDDTHFRHRYLVQQTIAGSILVRQVQRVNRIMTRSLEHGTQTGRQVRVDQELHAATT